MISSRFTQSRAIGGLGDTTLDLIYRYDPYRPIVLRRPADSADAVRELLEGNGRLVNLLTRMQRAIFDEEPREKSVVVPIDLLSMGLPFCAGSASDQLPFASPPLNAPSAEPTLPDGAGAGKTSPDS